ncbi:11409_t:CDS:1, partial [Funneliformis geosporum]
EILIEAPINARNYSPLKRAQALLILYLLDLEGKNFSAAQ